MDAAGRITDLAARIRAVNLEVGADPPEELTGLAELLAACVELVAAAREAKNDVEILTARAMPKPVVEIDGYVLERHSGKLRKEWDHERLAGVVRERALVANRVDADTGEVLPEPLLPEAVAVTRALLLAARLEWRVSALRDQGIDPDTFCTAERGRSSVSIRKPR